MTTPLQQAAQAMIARWDSTDWKDTPHTAHYIAELRKALDAELAQSVNPNAWMRHDSFKAMTDDEKAAWIESGNAEVVEEYTIPLYLHPPQPQATTPAGEISESVIDEFLEDYEMIGESEDGLEGCYVPDENDKALIKDAVFGLLEHVSNLAAQGDKPQTTVPVPEGYVLVPIEPTPKMVDSTWNDKLVGMSDDARNARVRIYKAMVEAAQGEKP